MNQPTRWKFNWMKNDWLRIPLFAIFLIPVIIFAFFYEWLWVSGLRKHGMFKKSYWTGMGELFRFSKKEKS